jgi:hypothetical protein
MFIASINSAADGFAWRSHIGSVLLEDKSATRSQRILEHKVKAHLDWS